MEMGLAVKDVSGDYVLAKEVKIEALEQFLKIGSYIIPRFVLYSVMLSVLFGYFVYIAGTRVTETSVWTYVFAVSGLTITWYETWRAWRRSP